MRYDVDELIRANDEARAKSAIAERHEQRQWDEQQEQRRAEAEDRYAMMRRTGRIPGTTVRVTERTPAEIFQRASDFADHDDEVEEMQRLIREERGGWVEAIDHDAELAHDRAKFNRDYVRRVAKDPAKIAEMERELERRRRELDQYLWRAK
jgi:hypothetical protein